MRIVIKIGTNLLTGTTGALNLAAMRSLAGEIASLKKGGAQVTLVTSGAIGAGMGKLGRKARPATLREKQALAAIGQPLLMDAYQEAFGARNATIAQVLVTRHDFDDRQHYINARTTLLALLELDVVPIINENDTVAVEEINFGDNDTLAALVAAAICADTLVLLTDVEGLYRGVPGRSELVRTVETITPEIEAYASGLSGSGKGTGGMKTKLAAARIATAAGVRMVIASGAKLENLSAIVSGEPVGTAFLPRESLEPRKCWIAFGPKARGSLVIDAGAAQAVLAKGKSLLPSGILAVEGDFGVGDMVTVCGPDRKEIARGLVNYTAQDLARIRGRKSAEIERILEGADVEEAIHRDNLVIL